jgi:hypothetical protein
VTDEAPQHGSRWAAKLAERRENHLQRGRLYRVLFMIAGTIVTLVGVAMLVLPGPALVVSEGLRKKVLDALFGAEEEFEYTSTTSTPTPAGTAA